MAKVTSKLQVTVPKVIAQRYGIRPGDHIEWVAAGDATRIIRAGKKPVSDDLETKLRLFDQATERHKRRPWGGRSAFAKEGGRERISTGVAALVDTNVLVYRFDNRFPDTRGIATAVLRRGILEDSVCVPYQAMVEFVAAVTRPIRGHVILRQDKALREAEEFLKQFTVLYPNEATVRTAVRGCAAYQLSWFDAHVWACAEHCGLGEILTEDLQHDRLYGTVRVVNPFLA